MVADALKLVSDQGALNQGLIQQGEEHIPFLWFWLGKF